MNSRSHLGLTVWTPARTRWGRRTRVGAVVCGLGLVLLPAAGLLATLQVLSIDAPVARDQSVSSLPLPSVDGDQRLLRMITESAEQLKQRLRSANAVQDLGVLGDPSPPENAVPTAPGQEALSIEADGSLLEGNSAEDTIFQVRLMLTSGLERIERARTQAARPPSPAVASVPAITQATNLDPSRPVTWPVSGGITDRFGWRILDGVRNFHTGIDIAAGMGTHIQVPVAGKVTWVGWINGYGGAVEVKHANGYSTLYAHLSYYTTEVGREVRAGDVIGYVGSTGHSTGPHLHFEIRRYGVPVDPLPYLR